MTEPLSSPSHCPENLERPQEYSVKLMQYQEKPHDLALRMHQLLASSTEPVTLLEQIAHNLGEAFRVDCCCLIPVGSDNSYSGMPVYWRADNYTPIASPGLRSPLRLELERVRLAFDAPTIEDLQTIRNSLTNACLHLSLQAETVLTISTQFQGRNNGVISLISCQPRYWHESDKEMLRSLAPIVAIALSQISQTQIINSLQQRVRVSNQYQSLINRLTALSGNNLELNEILELAITGTAAALQVERGLVLLLKYVDPLFNKNRSKQDIPKAKATVAAQWHSQTDSVAVVSTPDSFWLSECNLCQTAFTNSPQPVILPASADLTQTPGKTQPVANLFNLPAFPSLLLQPLESQGRVLGYLVFQQQTVRHWLPEELSLVEMVSAQVSNAIIHMQTLRQVQTLVDERTAQLKRSLEVQGKLYEKTRQHVEQLRELNRMKDEFIDTVSHELRTPLTSMNLAIRMLRESGPNQQRQQKYLGILEQQCDREIKLINDLLKLRQIETNQAPLQLENINLNSKLSQLAQTFNEQWGDKELHLSLELPTAEMQVRTDAESLERILQELLTNAGKYSEPDTTVVLKVWHQVHQDIDQIVLNLTNIGQGISQEAAQHIFDKFWRPQGVTKQAIAGTGLGLALVKCLAQHLNGAIAVSSQPITDSTLSEISFTLTLPQCFDNG